MERKDEELISDIVPDEYKKRANTLADQHVEWFMKIVSPLLITEFVHGYRHGWEDALTRKANN